jgi:sulfate transport system ATP-binding protein
VLLGPSGSGKSTLLRAIAGLTGVDHGRISLHGNDVTHVSARQRGVGFVFQNYALFRHMSVGENIEFALRVRRMRAEDRRQRRKELLRLVALEGMDDRLPSQLSGGQAAARRGCAAHWRTNLKCCCSMTVRRARREDPRGVASYNPPGTARAEDHHRARHARSGEAFALADRIGVMNLGRLLESGQPDELYDRPATRFVATFLGAANLLLAKQTEQGIRFGATPGQRSPDRETRRWARARSRRSVASRGDRACADARQPA